MTTVLIVEDDPKIRANLLLQLRDEGFEPTAVSDAEAALERLEQASEPLPDLLLLDVRLPGMSGVDLVRRLSGVSRLPPTVIVSGEASITETVEALRLGVHDFIEKPFTNERLARSIRNTLDHAALRRQVADLEARLEQGEQLLGASAPMATLRQRIAQAAPTDATVLIRGESGTGKELVADAIHRGSPRRDQPFIKTNCAAIPTHLVEDELFGHVRGAFTDARSDKPGLFEEADRGTLFLDEIGDMEPGLQGRLLRVLEDGRVRRLGGIRDLEVDVRVVAATHTDLETAMRSGAFREDLYYRLAHLPIEVPPLRDRRHDLRLLFEHFVRRAWQQHRMRPRQVDDRVYPMLEAYQWPGNVRELRSLCERLVVFGGDPIMPDQLPEPFQAATREGDRDVVQLGPDQSVLPLREFRARAEKEYIERVLGITEWNVTAAARLLGVQRTHLHQKLANYGSRRPVDGSDKA